MRKIILMIAAVFASITFAYADSCSSGQGSLSYQISGCGDQARACCTGEWCSWGTTSCATCNDTSTSTACSNVSSSYCAGTATATRSVTGTCGSCSYSGWGSWNTGSCIPWVTCNREYTSSTQAYGSCGGSLVYNYYRDATNTCGSCTWGGWNHYSSSDDRWGPYCGEGRAYTSSTQAYGSCGGSLVYYYYRDPSATCSGCSWPGWTHYSTSDNRSWPQTCRATSESTACSNVSSSYCSGTATRTRSVTGTCGSCSYSGWSSWNTSSCGGCCTPYYHFVQYQVNGPMPYSGCQSAYNAWKSGKYNKSTCNSSNSGGVYSSGCQSYGSGYAFIVYECRYAC